MGNYCHVSQQNDRGVGSQHWRTHTILVNSKIYRWRNRKNVWNIEPLNTIQDIQENLPTAISLASLQLKISHETSTYKPRLAYQCQYRTNYTTALSQYGRFFRWNKAEPKHRLRARLLSETWTITSPDFIEDIPTISSSSLSEFFFRVWYFELIIDLPLTTGDELLDKPAADFQHFWVSALSKGVLTCLQVSSAPLHQCPKPAPGP